MTGEAMRALVGAETHRPPPTTLARALVAAVAQIGPIPKSREVRAGARRFEYAPLEQILAVVRPVLAAHDLCLLQDLSSGGEWLDVSTIILHVSGETMRFGPLRFVAPPGAQDLGALVTYGRRYCVLSSLGIAPDDEQDLDSRPPVTLPPAGRAGGHMSSPPDPVSDPAGQGVEAGIEGSGGDAYLAQRMERVEGWRQRLAGLDGYAVATRARQAFLQVHWRRDWEPTHTQLGVLEAALKQLEPEIVAAEHDRDGTTPDDPSPEAGSQDPYESWTVAKLRSEGRMRGIREASKMSKTQLVPLLHDLDALEAPFTDDEPPEDDDG